MSLLTAHEYRSGFDTNCSCGAPGIWSWADYTSHIREACAIRTVEELDALPDGAIVRGASGHAFEKSSESWTLEGRRWGEAGNASPERSEEIDLPALLPWNPGWQA